MITHLPTDRLTPNWHGHIPNIPHHVVAMATTVA